VLRLASTHGPAPGVAGLNRGVPSLALTEAEGRRRDESSRSIRASLLANFGKEDKPDTVIARVSQETLANMIGTTRSRVSFFMNKFRKLGLIKYAKAGSGKIEVHSSLLNIVLHD